MTQTQERTVALSGGVRMPLVGLGTWQLKGNRGYEAIRHALDVGYRHLDTATMYENESDVGRAIRDSGVPREEIFVTTKLPPGREGRERKTLAASLKNLGTGYVDLWLIHWPPSRESSIGTWRELLAVRDEGLARAVGVSNFSTAQIDELIAATGQAPAVNQIPWSPASYDAAQVAQSRERGVVLEGYSPFKRTRLTDPVLGGIARAHAVTVPQVVVRWHVQHRIVVIPKSATPERIETNFDVYGFSLSDEEMSRIDGLSRR